MLKKRIVYNDFNGERQEEDFYFNLTTAEVSEMNLEYDGNLKEYILSIVNSRDGKKISKFFRDFILKTYGEKSPNGKYFVKNDDIREKFSSTEAYSVLFMDLVTDAKAAAEFINAVLPTVEDKHE